MIGAGPCSPIADLKALRDQRAMIETKEGVIVQILDALTTQGGEVAERISALGAAAGLGSLREQITQVLLTRQGEEPFMVPKDVRAELVSRGNRNVTLENMRVTMKRMAEDGDLVRPDESSVMYGLPSLPQEVLDIARDMERQNR